MAKAKKGVIPPHLKKFLFKKGRHKRVAARRTVARRKPVKRRIIKKRARKVNPSLASRQYIKLIAFRAGGPAMHFDGKKFTTNGKPLPFTNEGAAQNIAQLLANQFPILHKYKFRTEPMYSK